MPSSHHGHWDVAHGASLKTTSDSSTPSQTPGSLTLAVQKRLAFTPLLNHDFLDAAWRTQRFVYADGTEITIDLENDTYNIQCPDE